MLPNMLKSVYVGAYRSISCEILFFFTCIQKNSSSETVIRICVSPYLVDKCFKIRICRLLLFIDFWIIDGENNVSP